MDGIQVGLLGADRSDGADTVLVSTKGDKNCVIALQGVLQDKREAREGKMALEGHLKQGPFKKGAKDIRVRGQKTFLGSLSALPLIPRRVGGGASRRKKKALKRALQIMEAGVGIEPAYTVLQTAA